MAPATPEPRRRPRGPTFARILEWLIVGLAVAGAFTPFAGYWRTTEDGGVVSSADDPSLHWRMVDLFSDTPGAVVNVTSRAVNTLGVAAVLLAALSLVAASRQRSGEFRRFAFAAWIALGGFLVALTGTLAANERFHEAYDLPRVLLVDSGFGLLLAAFVVGAVRVALAVGGQRRRRTDAQPDGRR